GGAVAASPAGFDDDEIALAEQERLLAPHGALARRARIQRDAKRRGLLAARQPVGRHDSALEHARERHVGAEDAIGPTKAQAASVLALSARARSKRLLLDEER